MYSDASSLKFFKPVNEDYAKKGVMKKVQQLFTPVFHLEQAAYGLNRDRCHWSNGQHIN